jgi:hypothetical protein
VNAANDPNRFFITRPNLNVAGPRLYLQIYGSLDLQGPLKGSLHSKRARVEPASRCRQGETDTDQTGAQIKRHEKTSRLAP